MADRLVASVQQNLKDTEHVLIDLSSSDARGHILPLTEIRSLSQTSLSSVDEIPAPTREELSELLDRHNNHRNRGFSMIHEDFPLVPGSIEDTSSEEMV